MSPTTQVTKTQKSTPGSVSELNTNTGPCQQAKLEVLLDRVKGSLSGASEVALEKVAGLLPQKARLVVAAVGLSCGLGACVGPAPMGGGYGYGGGYTGGYGNSRNTGYAQADRDIARRQAQVARQEFNRNPWDPQAQQAYREAWGNSKYFEQQARWQQDQQRQQEQMVRNLLRPLSKFGNFGRFPYR